MSLPRKQKSGVNWSQAYGQTEIKRKREVEEKTVKRQMRQVSGEGRGERRERRERGERTEWGGMREGVRDHSGKGDEGVRREITGKAFSTGAC